MNLKKNFLFLLTFLIFSFLVSGQSINITNPTSNTTWHYQDPVTITWTKSGNMSNSVSINLLHKNGQSVKKILATNAPNSGSFSWTVNVLEENDYLIRINVHTSANYPTPVRDTSSLFKIRAKQPDLYVAWAKVEPNIINVRTYIYFSAEVRNLSGKGVAKASKAMLYVNGTSAFTKEISIPEIQSGHGHRIYYHYYLKQAGHYLNVLKLDYKNTLSETNEGNNRKALSYKVNPLPDLVVCFKKYMKVNVPGKSWFPVKVKNKGDAPSKPSRLRFWIQKRGVKHYNIPKLAPGQEYGIQRSEYWTFKGSTNFSLRIDDNNLVLEVNDNNNKIEGIIYRGGKYGFNSKTACSDQIN